MKIQVKNIGAIKQAEFELGDFTIICGCNNTGKTYATYALFGFLTFWRDVFSIKISESIIGALLNDGTAVIDIRDYENKAEKILSEGCREYVKHLPTVFASSEKNFTDSDFSIRLDKDDIKPVDSYERIMGAAKSQLFSISKKEQSPEISIGLLVEKDKAKIPPEIVSRIVGDALKDILFGHLFHRPFIASAERTGAAIFRKELNFARNRLLEQMSSMEKDINPFDLLDKVYSDYALPVKENVDFTRQLESVSKKTSFIANSHPELLSDFAGIIGGSYVVTKNDELYFTPTTKKLRLNMDESSSSVRSLLDIGFYLRHVANPGDLLMIDEPELNLHPENQRRVARLLSSLVNKGVRVFITTHSDYIIKELNTLIMLGNNKPHLSEIMEKEGYKSSEIISPEKVKVYIAEEANVLIEGNRRKTKCQTLTSTEVSLEYGIDARSFDETIDKMNRIQEKIIFGGSTIDE